MFSLSAFIALFSLGHRGYPMVAYSRTKTPFQRRKGQTPPAFVTVDTDSGCQRITYSQAEFAARFKL